MSMRTIIVVGSVLAMGATAQAQKPQPAQRDPLGKPAQLDFFFSAPLEGKVVKGAPYSATIETESVQTLGDGNRIVHRTTARVYRDGEGRIRREEKNGSTETITITDPVTRRSFTLDPATRTASQTFGFGLFDFYLQGPHMSPWRYTWDFKPTAGFAFSREMQNEYTFAFGQAGRGAGARRGRDEYVEEPLPNRTIEGVVASGIRRTTTIPQGAIGNEQPIKTVSEEWTSADLQVLVLTDVNDPRTGRTTYRLTNINRAEPDPALFKVPAGYTTRLGLRPKK